MRPQPRLRSRSQCGEIGENLSTSRLNHKHPPCQGNPPCQSKCTYSRVSHNAAADDLNAITANTIMLQVWQLQLWSLLLPTKSNSSVHYQRQSFMRISTARFPFRFSNNSPGSISQPRPTLLSRPALSVSKTASPCPRSMTFLGFSQPSML
jgi:hypothetical protein